MRLRWSDLARTPAALMLTALVVGLGAGVGAIAFRELITAVTRVATGRADYAAVAGATLPWLPEVGRWFLLVVPVVGGLIYGPLVYRYAREARGHGVPEVMLAVGENGGRIRPRVAVVKALASALCIGTGGSVGREGPIVQIGSALGSSLGQWVRVPARRLPLLVGCGAAGGIAATFNAPLAGVLFALEILLVDLSALTVTVVALSSVAANTVARAAEGSQTFLRLGTFAPGPPSHYIDYGLIGVAGALVGVGFTRLLYATEDLADRVWRGPEWLRPAVGGLLLGLLLVALPQMYGVGYPVLATAVAGGYGVLLLLALLVGKAVATSLTLAIGGSGGVFAPSLFLGATAGALLGDGAGALGTGGPVGAYGLVGMAAVLAGATRAPATAVVIVAEITGSWSMIVPLMLAVVVATGGSRLLGEDTIYTLKLRRRGVVLHPPGTPTRGTVGEADRDDGGAPDPGALPCGPLRWSPVTDGTCVVELCGPPPDGWATPGGFVRLDPTPSGYPVLVGPRDGLDALATSLSDPGEDRP